MNFRVKHKLIWLLYLTKQALANYILQRFSYEHDSFLITDFWIIGKLQYAGIYGKLKRRNKLWSNEKFDNDKIDDDADNYYLCGGSSNYWEIINLMFNILGQSQPIRQPIVLRQE